MKHYCASCGQEWFVDPLSSAGGHVCPTSRMGGPMFPSTQAIQNLAVTIGTMGAEERSNLCARIKELELQVDEARKALVALFSSFVEVCKTSTGTFTEFQRNAIALAKPFLDCQRHGYYGKYQTGEAPCSCPTTQANEGPKTGQEKGTEKRKGEAHV